VPLAKASPPPTAPQSQKSQPPAAAAPASRTLSELRLSVHELLTTAEQSQRSSHELLARTDSLIQGFSRAVERFTRHSRREALSAVLVAALLSTAAATLATLLTLAAMAPKLGFVGILRALLRHG
jgi:hypothetical protein